MLDDKIQRVSALNQDVDNTPAQARQDCSDVVNIAVFFDGTGNNKDADEKKRKWANPARLWRNAQTLKETNKKKGRIYPDHAIYVFDCSSAFVNFRPYSYFPYSWHRHRVLWLIVE